MAGCTESKLAQTLRWCSGKDDPRSHPVLPKAMALALLCSAASLHSQTLPSMAPTAPATPPVTSPPVTSAPSAHAAAGPAIQPAQVAYTAGRLQVNAENSSLNQILREIGRLTGMKITGGVAEERVFGSYGPADPSVVLSALLNGTGSNMMVRFDATHRPAELVLTPRSGGATPPDPNAARYASREDDLPPERRFAEPHAPWSAPTTPGVNPAQTPGVPPVLTEPAAGTATGANMTTQQSPNGVKTPQEIYDQLMKMQQPAKPPQ